MNNSKDIIINKTEKIKESIDVLYQQNTNTISEVFLEILQEIQEIIDIVFRRCQKDNEVCIDEKYLQGLFVNILSAFEEKDYTLVADLISYDFLEFIQEWCEKNM